MKNLKFEFTTSKKCGIIKLMSKENSKKFVDEEIRSKVVRVVGDNKSSTIMKRDEAIKLAKASGLNLVEIYFDKRQEPASTCKIMNYNKYIYELRQKEKQAKKQARAAEVKIKEVKFHLTSDDGDVNRKIAQARDFLTEGDKVKITMHLRGGEQRLKDMVLSKMKSIVSTFQDIATIDGKIEASGKYISVVIRPMSRK